MTTLTRYCLPSQQAAPALLVCYDGPFKFTSFQASIYSRSQGLQRCSQSFVVPSKSPTFLLDAADSAEVTEVLSIACTRLASKFEVEAPPVHQKLSQIPPEQQPEDWYDGQASVSEEDAKQVVQENLIDLTIESSYLHKVTVRLLDLKWGGESLPIYVHRLMGMSVTW